ncbi:MAG: respiratory nitrate reductase subunit gamma [Planctomycetes bacterium]|nr:respiratory nitrate reductase subunit gamma [Planctomycetota bacterium]MCB9825067.1 respiratory nitrate reductase subunit gamma [Planctomycetota bacterium]MCB9830059.1 respiratory nitrate reductase subunit gamma [Planctomycetota bacterium]MCB9902061.1 respiratory nitrate reductase subunit gamma [Planctomycetota bacterium]
MPGSDGFHHLDVILYAVLPYIAMFVFFLMTIYRYRTQSFSYSSLSSQFLENDKHFWSTVPFHYGILFVLLGHVVAFLVPRAILAWNGSPLRLMILEVTAMAAGLLTLVGLVSLIVRRLVVPRVRRVTTPADTLLYALLLFQVVTGLTVAYHHTWGSSWFATTLSPYLWSLVKLNPDISYVVPMPLFVKLHILGNWALILIFPFTRLVHVLVIPNAYLFRKTQVVRWNYPRREIRRPPGTERAS